MAVSEYDAFGPWIYEITDEHPVPRLFQPYIPQNESAVMLVKIPRNIERRVAMPDMDLYDYVVGAYPEELRVWKREGAQVVDFRIAYAEIEGICLTRHFLEGILELYTRSGTIELPFNAVSMDIMKRLAVYIRSNNTAQSVCLPETMRAHQGEVLLNLLFTNLLNDLRAEGETPLVYAYQPVIDRAAPMKKGLLGFLTGRRPEKLPATFHVLTPCELLIIKQDTAVGKQSKEELIYHYFYLPIAGVRCAGVVPCENGAGAVCTVSLANHAFQFPIETQNQSVARLYELLAPYLT